MQFAKENPVICSLWPEATFSFRRAGGAERGLHFRPEGRHGSASGRRLIGALLKTDTCGGEIACFVLCDVLSGFFGNEKSIC
ncbi:jg14271 [Pararge aegeria aegeria]|uniref:Jg14271 protein n=1 Tax=Pararge aegeria aegeria TaxID=348720 RepID=A0A8S4QPM7_9NEOP|nr:jg14271 [Pararge aegeria aegeria]